MPTVTTTSRGQATFRKEFFQHVGIQPGDKLDIEYLPNGEFRGRAAKKKGRIQDAFGMLEGYTNVKLTIEEIKEATEKAWAGEL
jgi:bifunctional DNA-binding transcriptional regulator/antitoxin component of YhaV-PrlF toxin-antitoxin module